MRYCLWALLCVMFVSPGMVRAGTFRWIEAEHPLATNFRTGPGNPFVPQTDAERAVLSGGAWIGAYGSRRSPLFAVYEFDLPAEGDYRLFARKFWKHGPYRFRVNQGEWIEVGADVALLDTVDLRPLVCANWTFMDKIHLKAGKNRLRIESTTNDGAIAFDCFLITDGPFQPRGVTKPEERLASREPGWFAWDPVPDAPQSPIDLRSLNEPYAGSKGRILSRDGRFVHEKTGESVRFWGVNLGPDIVRLDEPMLDELAAMLARRGVNHARLHGPIYTQEGTDAGRLDDRQVERTIRAVRILKKHGIYTTLSIYFPLWLKLDEAGGWPGYANQTPFGLLFFDERFQTLYRGWWRELLTRPDPVTGIALKDEPAVLSLEMLNEDSCFFWTFQPYKNIPSPATHAMERRFGSWLATRHGSIDAALARWPNDRLDGDRPAEGRIDLSTPWRWVNVKDERSKETVRFLFETQRDFYVSTRDFLRDELKSISLISASNWITADDQVLGPLERATYLAGDLIDRHAYYNGVHTGPRSGHSIQAGDTYADRSALRFEPEKPADKGPSSWNPIFDTSFNDLPTMVSELDWLEPNRFRTEAALLCAAYGSLQDVDALTFFAVPSPGWQARIEKFSTMTPVALGQSPAAALIYRLGLVEAGPTIVDGRLRLEDLLSLEGGIRGIDSKSALVGRRQTTIGDGPTRRPDPPDLGPFHDPAARTIRSATGQLTLDYGRGVLSVDAPGAQAVVGFFDTLRHVRLTNLRIESTMAYGAIAVVSLDGRPIHDADRLLVQVMSEQRNSGWQTRDEPTRTIVHVGGGPILVREFAGTIRFDDTERWAAQPLDAAGQPAGAAIDVSPTLELGPSTPYYLLTRIR